MGIITRLQSLQETAEAANEPMQRYFEVNGEKFAVLNISKKSNVWTDGFPKGEKPNTYPFDNIDMISIEIFELLQ